jgi:hypothetical protein
LIISGNIPSPAAPEQAPRHSFFIRNNDNLDQQLQRLWDIEELPNKPWTAEEILCEKHFKMHTTRNDTGRYIDFLDARVKAVWESRMNRQGDGFISYSDVFGNIQIFKRHILNLCKTMKSLAI